MSDGGSGAASATSVSTPAAATGASAPGQGAAGDAGASSAASTDPLEAARKAKHKIKVDGAEQELSYDELVRRAQLEAASHKRFQEAAGKAKFADAFSEAMDTGDHRALQKLKSLDPGKFKRLAENFLIEDMEATEMREKHPDRWEAQQEKKRREEAEARLKEREERDQSEAYQQELAAAGKSLDREITDVLQGAGRAKKPHLVKRMVDLMLASYDASGKRMSAKEALQAATGELDGDMDAYLSEIADMPVETLVKRLPPKLIKAISDYHIKGAVGSRPGRVSRGTTQQAQTPQPAQSSGGKGSLDSFYESMDKQFSNSRRR